MPRTLLWAAMMQICLISAGLADSVEGFPGRPLGPGGIEVKCGPLCIMLELGMVGAEVAEEERLLRAAPFRAIEEVDHNHARLTAALGLTAKNFDYLNTMILPPPMDGFGIIPQDGASYQAVFKHPPTPRELEVASKAHADAGDMVNINFDKLPGDLADFDRLLNASRSAVFGIAAAR